MSRHYPTAKTARATKASRGNNNPTDFFKLAKAYDKIERIKQQRRKSEMKEEEDLKYNQTTVRKRGSFDDTFQGLAILYLIVLWLIIFYISAIIFKIFAAVILILFICAVIECAYLGVKYTIKFVKSFTNRARITPTG